MNIYLETKKMNKEKCYEGIKHGDRNKTTYC